LSVIYYDIDSKEKRSQIIKFIYDANLDSLIIDSADSKNFYLHLVFVQNMENELSGSLKQMQFSSFSTSVFVTKKNRVESTGIIGFI